MSDIPASEIRPLATRVGRIKPSPTVAINSLALRLRGEGRDVISLAAGEPDFDTPEHVRQAAKAAIDAGFTRYTATGGTVGLRAAIREKFRRDNGLSYAASEVIATVGGKQACYELVLATCEAGHEVLIPAPYWVSYPDMVLLADATPVFLPCGPEQGFKLLPEQLEAAITPATRLLFLNSPANPTGAVYNQRELIELAEVLLRHPQVLVASDDIYEPIRFGSEPFANLLMVCPDLRDRVVIVHGVAKSHAMTGWRIGFAAGPAHIIAAMDMIQSQSTSNPTSIAQVAAEAALIGDQACVEVMRQAFESRQTAALGAVRAIAGFACLPAAGAFYLFPDVRGVLEQREELADDVALAAWLLDHAGVATVPGTAFGMPGHLRLSFATSESVFADACRRIGAALAA